jgi:hypothetical protein
MFWSISYSLVRAVLGFAGLHGRDGASKDVEPPVLRHEVGGTASAGQPAGIGSIGWDDVGDPVALVGWPAVAESDRQSGNVASPAW